MQLDHYVNTFGVYLKKKYQQRIKKLTINAAFTCPSRDGTLGKGGCTFCNVDSFSKTENQMPIAQQLEQGKVEHGKKASKYLAYFQAYTSTYEEVEVLRQKYYLRHHGVYYVGHQLMKFAETLKLMAVKQRP